jgi:hypothetical protein
LFCGLLPTNAEEEFELHFTIVDDHSTIYQMSDRSTGFMPFSSESLLEELTQKYRDWKMKKKMTSY